MTTTDLEKATKRRQRVNALRRFMVGLPRHSGAITPVVPDDRFQSLSSLYRFATCWTKGKSVLDLSCGTGFGCRDLMEAGAERVVGLEQASWAVRHGSKRYRKKGLSFREAPPVALPPDLGRFEVALAFNVLPRYSDVEQVLEDLDRHLENDGMLVASVPVVRDEDELIEVRRQGGFVSQFYPWYWKAILNGFFDSVRSYRHLPPEGTAPNFSSPFPSLLEAQNFHFCEVSPEELRGGESLAVVFVCAKVGAGSRSATDLSPIARTRS